jgi:hypothetical protein
MSDIAKEAGKVSVGPIVVTPSGASRFFDALVSVGGVTAADLRRPPRGETSAKHNVGMMQR